MWRQVCVVVLAVIIIGGFGIVGQARASNLVDGNELNDRYKNWEITSSSPSSIDPVVISKGMLFVGYAQGVGDSMDPILCTPSGVTGGQVFAIIGNYLKAHPEKWNESGSEIIFKALIEAYPCPKK